MRYLAMCAAAVGLLAMTANAGVNPALAAGATETKAPIVLAQAEPKKSETLTKKIKRAWRNLTGYKFAVACPVLFAINQSTCTETGNNRADARAKCIAQNPFCSVSDVR